MTEIYFPAITLCHPIEWHYAGLLNAYTTHDKNGKAIKENFNNLINFHIGGKPVEKDFYRQALEEEFFNFDLSDSSKSLKMERALKYTNTSIKYADYLLGDSYKDLVLKMHFSFYLLNLNVPMDVGTKIVEVKESITHALFMAKMEPSWDGDKVVEVSTRFYIKSKKMSIW